MYIIMLGAPGSGKGTLAKELSKEYSLVHISTGDIFRENIKNETELGKKANEYISKGQLVPDELTIDLVKNRLSQDDVKNGAILDGFPRTAHQAEELEKFIKNNNQMDTVAVLLDIPDEDLVKRVVNRVICSNKSCGAIYNTEFRKPKVDGICDICGSKLEKRADDNEKTVRDRLNVYHNNSKEIIEYYNEENVLFTLNPNIYSETVLEDNLSKVNEHLKSKMN
ncbi:adenylate kinase [Clostridium sp. CAG:273]|nr:adenylate kinase [Clostridia bacterium]CDE83409.1 adenylate kinase [Clostridium sp. CAG:273]